MPLPIVFRGSSGITAQYDWLDVTSGCGYRRYYASGSYLSGAAVYFLTTQTPDGFPYFYTYNCNDAAYTNGIDLDFDITFKVPCYITGTAIANITQGCITATNHLMWLRVTVYHVDAAATETSIGTADTDPAGAAVAGYYRECVKITLTGKHFKAGEKLRLNIKQYSKKNGGVAFDSRVYFDPSSGVSFTDPYGRTIGIDATFDVPFKIDIS